ncbi:MAG: VCBS repeat-containing protein, partial [Flavobacteriaceae bacterium]|nr:VCBS repeat-containing protein [Flavobacteriaceae bacterium]
MNRSLTSSIFNLGFLSLGFIIFIGCDNKTDDAENLYFSFQVLESQETGIDFSNTLEYQDDINIIEYLYFYNGGGVAIGDIDQDGLEDLYFSSNQHQDKLYKNLGSLQFADITEQANLEGRQSWSTGVTMEDINNDGLLDIYVCKVGHYQSLQGHNLVYINQGNGQFIESSKALGLDFSGFSTQAAFLDYDLDGDMDLYLLNHNVHSINSYGSIDKRFEKDSLAGDRFYENQVNENGKFIDKTSESGIYSSPLGYGLALRIADINGDHWPDIYVGNDFHENDYIYINNQDKTFTESIHSFITHTARFTMGVDFADLNGDHREDIYTTDMMPYDAEIFLKSGGEDTD